jgi:hypothetical protein
VEAFYFLAGRNDVALPAFFAANIANYSDDGDTLWGSYGFRWRNHFSVDQLSILIQHLRDVPDSRRAVLQMWDGAEELERAIVGGKDCCCNLSCVFNPQPDGTLDMEVYNRSNDLVFGALGANLVHFSILHQYVAAQVGMKKGCYSQVSSNTHVYTEFPITARFVNSDATLKEAYSGEPIVGFTTIQQSAYADQFKGLDLSDSEFGAQLFDFFDIFLEDIETPALLSEDSSTSDVEAELYWADCDEHNLDPALPDIVTLVLKPLMYVYANYKTNKNASQAIRMIEHARMTAASYESTQEHSPWFVACKEWMERRV